MDFIPCYLSQSLQWKYFRLFSFSYQPGYKGWIVEIIQNISACCCLHGILITVSTLTVSPLILLLLYPIKRFRKLLSYCGPKKYHALYVFLDTFQGHYKDVTNGTRDYRAASCISFVLRFGVVYVLDRSLRGRPISHYVPLASIMIITAL